jgi:hypothetical protein
MRFRDRVLQLISHGVAGDDLADTIGRMHDADLAATDARVRAECAAEIAAAVKRTESQARQEIAAILNNQNPPRVESLIFDPITVRVGMLHYPEKTIAAERKG